MADFDFAANVGTTIAFNPATDRLLFSGSLTAAGLLLTQAGADARIEIAGQSVLLATVDVTSLTGTHFEFADGSLVRIGTAGDDTLIGSAEDDYVDVSGGGTDQVSAGDGADKIVAGSGLSAADVIDGGSGFDILELSGTQTIVLTATTVRAVEQIRVGEGQVSLTLAEATVTTAAGFSVDASA